MSSTQENPCERLTRILRDHREDFVVVITGAGISHASGIPTFRGSDSEAVWNASDMEMATFEFFRRDPVSQWRWYFDRFATLEGARPNPAHSALAGYEDWQTSGGGRFLLITQNIDTLHEQAGSESMIKVHGTSDRLRCVRPGCELAEPHGSIERDEIDLDSFADSPTTETLPECPECGDLLRAHVLFFDEYYTAHEDYRFAEVESAAERADLMLFIGTSFSVGVTELFVRAGLGRGIPVLAIDPATLTETADLGIEHLQAPAETLLPDVLAEIRG